MATISLFRDTNMAAVTSCENKDAAKYQIVLICLEYAGINCPSGAKAMGKC